MELKFIHITKCAGSSIEESGKRVNIAWGKYHKEYRLLGPAKQIDPWHKCFSLLDSSIVNKYNWFTVVRNPYHRILSEYYCNYTGVKKTIHTKEEMNSYLIRQIQNRSIEGGHFTEQYKYLHPNKKIHILKFENLNEEFSKLMRSYNIVGIQLLKINVRSTKSYINVFRVSDFSNELIELINKVYSNDFRCFGYKKNTVGKDTNIEKVNNEPIRSDFSFKFKKILI